MSREVCRKGEETTDSLAERLTKGELQMLIRPFIYIMHVAAEYIFSIIFVLKQIFENDVW